MGEACAFGAGCDGGGRGGRWGERRKRARECLVTFEAVPGPGQVTYGENIAYRATFTNIGGTRSRRLPSGCVPYTVGAGRTEADSTSSSTCPTQHARYARGRRTRNGSAVRPAQAERSDARSTVVWKAPGCAREPGCHAICAGMSLDRRPLDDQGGRQRPTDPNDAFPSATGSVGDAPRRPGADAEKLRGGRLRAAPAACARPARRRSLRTNQAVSLDNPSRRRCAFRRSTPTAGDDSVDLGYATTITETLETRPDATVRTRRSASPQLGRELRRRTTDVTVRLRDRESHARLPRRGRVRCPNELQDHARSPTTASPSACRRARATRTAATSSRSRVNDKTKIWSIDAQAPDNGLWGW